MEIKPVRVWTEDAVYGVLLIGSIAQLMIGLTRSFVKPVKRISTKFIIDALKKFDNYDGFGRQRAEEAVLLELQRGQ